MTFEHRIRASVDGAMADVQSRLESELRVVMQEAITAALSEREQTLESERTAALQAAAEAARRESEAVEAHARAREREAGMAAVSRLLESIRTLDGASTLSEVLDALGRAAAAEAARTAVLVLRHDRLVGWRFAGFGDLDTLPRSVDLALADDGMLGQAVSTGRPITTRDAGSSRLSFTSLSDSRMGLAVPVNVGGRAVAVVYADSSGDGGEHQTPSNWPEVIEVLARHAARCLEALTVQKTASTGAPRFWVQPASRPGMAT